MSRGTAIRRSVTFQAGALVRGSMENALRFFLDGQPVTYELHRYGGFFTLVSQYRLVIEGDRDAVNDAVDDILSWGDKLNRE